MPRSIRPILIILAVFIPMAASAVDAPVIELVDGVQHVRNGARPIQGERTVTLQELWRVNVEEEDELIGVTDVALAGPEGTVWLADRQLGRLLVYSAAGNHQATLSREGEGPGELRGPSGLLWLPDGSLAVKDRKPGQLTVIDRAGNPRSAIHLSDLEGEPLAASWLAQVRSRAGVMAVCGYIFTNDEDGTPTQSRYFGIFDLDGREVARLMTSPSGFDFGRRTYDEKKNWFLDQGQFDVTPSGLVVHAVERDAYRFEVRDAAGALVRVVAREYDPRRRTAEDFERLTDGVMMNINGEVVELDSEFLPTSPSIRGIRALDDGTIWVLNGHGTRDLEAGIARRYDVFDAEGRFFEIVHVAAAYHPDNDGLALLDDGRWVIFRNLSDAWNAMTGEGDEASGPEDLVEEAPLEIICFSAED